MTRPTVAQVQSWHPEALHRLGDAWERAAHEMYTRARGAVADVLGNADGWRGSTAETAVERLRDIAHDADAIARRVVTAAVAAHDGGDRIATAKAVVLKRVSEAAAEGFAVADDGTVRPHEPPTALLVTLSGGDAAVAAVMLANRSAELTGSIGVALDRLGEVDADVAREIDEAFAVDRAAEHPAATVPVGVVPTAADVVAGWPSMSQDGIAGEIAAMTIPQRAQLIDESPAIVGNTDGVPWDMRMRANRINVAQAILDARDDEAGRRGAAFYRDLLREVDDPSRSDRRVDRQILSFDPARSSFVELNGDLATATSVAVLVPGTNTTLEGSAANTGTARRFVSATRGEVAAITYLGGPFPAGDSMAIALARAADPRFALDMAPRLVSFSADVDHTVDATGRDIPVTYIGHSYGGSILGTAEALGMTADRTLYLASAGAGVGVDDCDDWHNRNPDVLRFSMTAPGDAIELVQGFPNGPHGVDPDDMTGVIHLATGNYDDGRLMAGPHAHSDVIDYAASDSWRNILAVITGDREHIRVSN